MNYLLDTHAFLWWCSDDPILSEEASRAISDSNSVVFVSIASAWEISIKKALGKLTTPGPVKEAIQINAFRTLQITLDHSAFVEELPMHHSDPFDRMLIAQATLEDLTLVTRDKGILQYDVSTLIA